MGSPMPDTPIHQREQRKEAIHRAFNGVRRDNPVFSSKYKGLEKEVASFQALPSFGEEENPLFAEVHEGQVSLLMQSSRYWEKDGIFRNADTFPPDLKSSI